MPTYLYQGLHTGQEFEISHSIELLPLCEHPQTKEPLKRIYTAPSLGLKHSQASTQKILSDSHIEKHGFTKYQKDKSTGQYHKMAGKNGPSVLGG